jgi:hypothetical protein
MHASALLFFTAVAAGDLPTPEECAAAIATEARCRAMREHMIGRDENSPYSSAEAAEIVRCQEVARASSVCQRVAILCEQARKAGLTANDIPSCEGRVAVE